MTTQIYVSQKRSISKIRKMVFTFAVNLAKNGYSESWSECLKTAWYEVRHNSENYQYIEFEKTNGEIAKRVILLERWGDRYEVKGTGHALKPGQTLYLDAVKQFCGAKCFTGSYYIENLIEKFYLFYNSLKQLKWQSQF